MGCFIHNWGSWEKVPGKCVERKVCKKCGETKERSIPHTWQEWKYVQDDSCKQVRACSSCHQSEERTAGHNWSDWQYVSEDSCEQIRTCRRCGAGSKSRIQHDFDPWAYADEDSCIKVRRCRHCGRASINKECHEWSEPSIDRNTCEKTQYCLRCGEKKTIADAAHKWKTYSYHRCIETGARILESHIEEKEKMLEIATVRKPSVDISYAVSLSEVTVLRNRRARYVSDGDQDHNIMGRVCEKCGRIESMGITKEEMENLLEDGE